jgi:hypothetical protein
MAATMANTKNVDMMFDILGMTKNIITQNDDTLGVANPEDLRVYYEHDCEMSGSKRDKIKKLITTKRLRDG